MEISHTRNPADPDWLELRAEFIPEIEPADQQQFLQDFGRNADNFGAFIASDAHDQLAGFCEVSLRHEYVNGCHQRPALYLEGIYVKPAFRGQGVAARLCQAAGKWGHSMGAREFASDVDLDNELSLSVHRSLGFEETERVVYFRKLLVDHHNPNPAETDKD